MPGVMVDFLAGMNYMCICLLQLQFLVCQDQRFGYSGTCKKKNSVLPIYEPVEYSWKESQLRKEMGIDKWATNPDKRKLLNRNLAVLVVENMTILVKVNLTHHPSPIIHDRHFTNHNPNLSHPFTLTIPSHWHLEKLFLLYPPRCFANCSYPELRPGAS
jgi:hypothetical protein